MLTKKEISETLGLSCVEYYFLAWLKKYYDITKLYGHSFISLGQVFDDFSHGATYQNYCYLPRLQDVAEEYGVVEHMFYACSGSEALELLRKQSQDVLCMIRVNTSFFTGFKRSSWREDHYVCVNDKLEWINEYPLSEGRFTVENFLQVYDGGVCIYRLNDASVSVPDFASEGFRTQLFRVKDLPTSLGALESAIGILRVTRKRLEKYYVDKEGVRALLHKENVFLDKLYFDVHLRRLQELKNVEIDKTKAYKDLYTKLETVIEWERNITEEFIQ